VPDKREDKLCEIEETQSALRSSIAGARAMTEKTDRLLEKHRNETLQSAPGLSVSQPAEPGH